MILILMTARSGSSLVAKIFAAHGFDAGNERVYSHGYETFENAKVNRWIDDHIDQMRPLTTGHPCKYIPGIEDCIPPNGVVKTAVEYSGLFVKMDFKLITVKRDVRSIAESVAIKRGEPGTADSIVGAMMSRMAGMDRLRDKWNGAEIDTDQIMSGDFAGVRAAFEHHGLEFDEAKARACVDVTKWHQW